jgi:hypothetical protein
VQVQQNIYCSLALGLENCLSDCQQHLECATASSSSFEIFSDWQTEKPPQHHLSAKTNIKKMLRLHNTSYKKSCHEIPNQNPETNNPILVMILLMAFV